MNGSWRTKSSQAATALSVAVLTSTAAETAQPADDLEALTEGQRIADFTVECVYENESQARIGTRLRHVPSGFVLDVLRIQSVPQAFVWVNTPPPSDQGEPHTLEHLLLGKGTKGQSVASLEAMSLGSSSAYTEQWRTCYHFHTEAGLDVFFHLLREKLEAMLQPTFSDEEIRREVCNLGVTTRADGSLWLEEKGTVYNEMVSTYERPDGPLWDRLPRTLYGPTHPLAYSSGGVPSAIRELGPDEIRAFHARTHRLNNMGMMVALDRGIGLPDCLARIATILHELEPGADRGEDPATQQDRFPPSSPAPSGSIVRTLFPHPNANEPGSILLAWPADRRLALPARVALSLFVDAIAGGETSNLYRTFIDSETRRIDLGASGVWDWIGSDLGQPVVIGFSDVDPARTDEATLRRVREIVLDEIRAVAALPAGSPELRAFNDRVQNLLREERRSSRNLLNSPPQWGYRGTGSAWLERVQDLRNGGFRRNLALVECMEYVQHLLESPTNVWTELVSSWGLLAEPHILVAVPDAETLARSEREREERLAGHVAELRERFGAETDSAAIAAYAAEYGAATAKIDAELASVELPRFLDDPPLTLDDRLTYHTMPLPGGRELVVSVFEDMTASTAGLALSLEAIPESLLVYVPALRVVARKIGVLDDGRAIPYDEFEEILRREVSSLDVYTSASLASDRVEIVFRGSGTTLEETERALYWLRAALFHSNLRPENLPRIRDAVEQELAQQRNRTRGPEETWVQNPSNALRMQDRPLYLAAESFLTAAHSLHRLRWMLLGADPSAAAEFASAAEWFGGRPENADRERLTSWLAGVSARTAGGSVGQAPDVPLDRETLGRLSSLSTEARRLVHEAVSDLAKLMSDLPDAGLAGDVEYLWRQMAHDVQQSPDVTLLRVAEMLDTIRHQDLARGFLVGSAQDTERLAAALTDIAGSLDPARSAPRPRSSEPLIATRAQQRMASDDAARPGEDRPLFFGLANEATRAGVHVHTARCASYRSHDDESLLRFLAARLYGGGGAHSLFMKTWSAGLAYSNGIRSDERSGTLFYYAERCPDLAQTLKFAVDEIAGAPRDPSLGEYAVAQAFDGGRAASRYEVRGEAMAADLADGVSSGAVSEFRTRILELRKQPGFYDELHRRLRSTCGAVLPGLGGSAASYAEESAPTSLVIGPEKQLQSWETYLRGVEKGATLTRIYPRDFWQITDRSIGSLKDAAP